MQVRRLLIGQGVGDGRVAPLVIIVCRRPQETSSHWSVFTQEVWEKKRGQEDWLDWDRDYIWIGTERTAGLVDH